MIRYADMHIIARLKDPEQSVFVSVVYPESTPIIEAYRAMLDLKGTGIPGQLVIANQVILANRSSNAHFGNRRAIQIKYLNEIQNRFGSRVLVMPLLDKEIRGVEVLNCAAQLLFEQNRSEEQVTNPSRSEVREHDLRFRVSEVRESFDVRQRSGNAARPAPQCPQCGRTGVAQDFSSVRMLFGLPGRGSLLSCGPGSGRCDA